MLEVGNFPKSFPDQTHPIQNLVQAVQLSRAEIVGGLGIFEHKLVQERLELRMTQSVMLVA